MSQEIETPFSRPNVKYLEGDDPDMEQLKAKILILEERFKLKQELILEKELINEELDVINQKMKARVFIDRHIVLNNSETALYLKQKLD